MRSLVVAGHGLHPRESGRLLATWWPEAVDTEVMGAVGDWRATAKERRANIVTAMQRHLDPRHSDGSAARFATLLQEQAFRPMLVSADIDGLVTASLLAQASGWRAVGLIVKSEVIYLHPDYHPDNHPDLVIEDLFGVDVLSTRFDNISNHALLWGPRKLQGGSDSTTAVLQGYDEAVQAATSRVLVANPNLWVPVEGGSTTTKRPLGVPYRYPMGAAHVALAMLEVIGAQPRLFDRDYLPWLIANCDGAVGTLTGGYGFNVNTWWSCLAGAVGPGSVSEQVYSRVSSMRATDFPDTVNRLALEDPDVADHLDGSWRLAGKSLDNVAPVLGWISSLSGWPDPLLGGAEHLRHWKPVSPPSDIMPINALPLKGSPPADRTGALLEALISVLSAVHTSLAYGGNMGNRFGWVQPWDGLGSRVGTPALQAVSPTPAAALQLDLDDSLDGVEGPDSDGAGGGFADVTDDPVP